MANLPHIRASVKGSPKTKKGRNPMTPRVEEGLKRALKAQGISMADFNKQFKKRLKD